MSAASALGNKIPRYRRRRPLPAVIMLVVLGVLSVFVWTKVFRSTSDIDAATNCNPPTPPSTAPEGQAPPKAGQVLGRDSLDRTDPAVPSRVQVRVLNANGQRNQASLVAEELYAAGVNKAAEPGNDPVYPNFDMHCHGQIRFGPNGAGAARTLSLLVPCAQLVRDERQDATVDLALGSKFGDIKPNHAAKRVLADLRSWGERQPTPEGGQAAEAGRPPIEANLLAEARDVHC
ncbi:LytR cell envelope-related transcriptional attenuator [Streptoalloteichus tenebrarius]|uniref:LytR cell envelope-related transcriptional attenuator n=1 Tax=Streptoalloteichus tenebrarius (strain ATCC 17920 / DSM 40477 / JCM 4838 / CBS 697.72 / NBRC 16177 / NCIMB 11028 / NRRL B-12390 / A12253. 1 / ISP 5477) TaxID=1933 RepID=A0ABT1HMU4_STRSD|nr:envelope integrity protein Cei [Streptoalloteichus tenebrarius]MCP2256851.1 LytR cell envelope-related transcriptional attenuator [Streptoalloteichus tenebrarius]BFF00242.1 envelope integrity protein Cei [Streptoalloteichus tenebrarius]